MLLYVHRRAVDLGPRQPLGRPVPARIVLRFRPRGHRQSMKVVLCALWAGVVWCARQGMGVCESGVESGVDAARHEI